MNIVALVLVVLIQILLIVLYITSSIMFNDNLLYFNKVPIYLIFVTLLNVLTLYILAMIYKQQEKRKVEQTELTHVEEFRSLVTSVRSDRHDLNNHLTVISGLMKIGNYESANNYINEMVGDIRINNKALTIENPILASMLYSKMDKFKREQVPFEVNVCNEDIVHALPSTDLIRLLSNLLDNAYEATIELPVDQRKIGLSIDRLNDELKVIVENTSIIKEFNEGNFTIGYSTKSDNGKRGYGLSIIQDIIDKYNGSIKINTKHDLVIFEIIIPREVLK